MRRHTFSKTFIAATLFTAIPFAAVSAVTASPAATAQAQHLTNLQTRGEAEIDRRLTNLNAAQTKLNASTKLSAADKNTLTTQITDERTALTSLRAKLAADTDLTIARTDVQSIVTDYRVYVLMLPKAHLVAAADRFSVVEDQLTTIAATLQTKITAQKAAGKDVATLQASLDDLQAKITDAKSKTDGLVTKLLAIQPADYNASHTVLTTYRQSLAAAQTDLKAARTDAKNIVAVVKSWK